MPLYYFNVRDGAGGLRTPTARNCGTRRQRGGTPRRRTRTDVSCRAKTAALVHGAAPMARACSNSLPLGRRHAAIWRRDPATDRADVRKKLALASALRKPVGRAAGSCDRREVEVAAVSGGRERPPRRSTQVCVAAHQRDPATAACGSIRLMGIAIRRNALSNTGHTR